MLRKAVVSNDHKALLDELCLLAESFTPNAVATVMLFDEARTALFVENAPSLSDDAIEAFQGLRSGDGSCGNAVFHNEPMYVCDTFDDPRWSRLTEMATRFNICSCFSFPIPNASGESIGSFAISSFEHRSPNGFHLALLETCTSICSVVLQRREDERFRRQILEEQIRADRVESLGILASGIAHDFNNLLAVIMGNVDLSSNFLSAGPAKEGLDLALKAIESASELTRQLLTIAKGRNPNFAPQDIRSIIRDAAEFALHGSSVSCTLMGLESLTKPIIQIDGGEIGQMIQNLVLNARHAMPHGGKITICCTEVDETDQPGLETGPYLKLTVRDNGMGIAPEVLEHLFEPYFTTRDTGSGLGLFLCYSIVKSHGGRIRVQSELSEGTEFTVHLPSANAQHSPTNTQASSSSVLSPIKCKVLIMDDDELVRRTLGRVLEQLGCQVVQANGGEEALALYDLHCDNNEPFEITILDLTIPGGMGGIETMQALRKRNPSAKIIVSSGYAVGDAFIDHEAAGFDGSIIKPYRITTVRDTLVKLLRDEIA